MRRNKRRSKFRATSIERKVAEWLGDNNIYYRTQYRVDHFSVDFFIPSVNLVIQTDGCYWHFNPCDCNVGKMPSGKQQTQLLRDQACNGVLLSRGLKVLRLWECNINNNWEQCAESILKALEG